MAPESFGCNQLICSLKFVFIDNHLESNAYPQTALPQRSIPRRLCCRSCAGRSCGCAGKSLSAFGGKAQSALSGPLGWAFKKDTNDTRESAAIYVADMLIEEQATIKVFDPKVTETQILLDLDYLNTRSEKENSKYLQTQKDPYKALEGSHAVAVLTEWVEFKTYDWQKIYDGMQKPAFIFDGRNILDKTALEAIGFKYNSIGR